MLDVLGGDLQTLVSQVAHLPQMATEILDVTLRTRARGARSYPARRLADLAGGLDRLEAQNRQLLAGQGYSEAILEAILPVIRRMIGVADFVEDLRTAGLSAEIFGGRLRQYRQGAAALVDGRAGAAEHDFQALAGELPSSAAAQVALSATQAAEAKWLDAARSIEEAARLRPRTGNSESCASASRARPASARWSPSHWNGRPRHTPRGSATSSTAGRSKRCSATGGGEVFRRGAASRSPR